MADHVSLPNYRGMFGDAARGGDESRSVYSPAAYLADLLQLVDDHFQDAAITKNRPGIREVPLDAAHTDTEVPYLDVVNEVLARRLREQLGQDAYEALPAMTFPFTLPYSREDVRRRRLLAHAGVAPVQLYRQFATDPDPDVVARELLGLSLEDHRVVTAAATGAADVTAGYGLAEGDDIAVLEEVGRFREQAGLTAPALRELLFQDLSDTSTDAAGNTERSLAAAFFVNQGQGRVSLSPDGTRLVGSDGPVSWQWFDRASRVVRLADRIGMSLTDLDLVLRTCCRSVLDAASLRTVATVVQLQALYDVPVDVVCSLVAPMSAMGIGDADVPVDLFNRTFNGAGAEQGVILAGPFMAAAYAGRARLTCDGDLLDPRADGYRRRVSAGVGLSEADLGTVVTRFRAELAEGTGPFEAEIGVAALSLLHRIGTLTRTLQVSVADLFGVLDVLRRDPSIRALDPFDIAIAPGTGERDPYRILAGGQVGDGLWLARILLAVTQWTKANDIAGAELAAMVGGSSAGWQVHAGGNSAEIAALDGLHQQFQGVLLTRDTFVSDRFDDRDAAVVHRAVTGAGGPVSAHDARLVRLDAAAAASSAFEALARLAPVTREDFRRLGIEERLLEKIFANLVFRGYLRADGTLIEQGFPARPEDLRLAGGFGTVREAVFDVVSQLRLDAAAAVTAEAPAQDEEAAEEAVDSGPADAADVREVAPDRLDPASFFPSDLQWVEGLAPADDPEVYDNLVYNRYLDADGTVTRNEFFEAAANAADLVVDADLGDAGPAVWAHIRAQTARFDTEPFTLDPAIFAELRLGEPATQRLVDNLRFTGHLDAAGSYTDKAALLALGRDRLDVALEFYPLRRLILAAIQAQIATFRASCHTFPAESLREIADATLAGVVLGRLDGEVVVDGRVRDGLVPAILDGTAELGLGVEFGPAEEAAVRLRLAAILGSQQRYCFDPGALAVLDVDADETDALVDLLQASGELTAELMVARDRIAFFLDVHSALEFSVDGFGDYAKDVFFLLHAVATQTAAATDEIVAALAALADSQQAALFAGLQELYGVAPAVVETMCTVICGTATAAVDALVVPVLRAGAPTGRVTALPTDVGFGLLHRRLGGFAAVASKLNLSAAQTEIVFRDRDLVTKFPERLVLPPGVTTFDALLASGDGHVYLFAATTFWQYSASTYALLTTAALTTLSHRFAELASVDAAFVDAGGAEWLVGRDGAGVARTFVREGLTSVWVRMERTWGAIRNTFADPARIDTALRDREGKTYLFSGDQYVRYSGPDHTDVDPGYPRTIAGNWEREGLDADLPAEFRRSVDASFQGLDGVTYLFTGGRYLPAAEGTGPVLGRWGLVRNGFAGATGIDAAYTRGGAQFLVRGDQVIRYTDGIENDGVRVDEGYPLRLESALDGLPVEFESGIDAAFTTADGTLHLFRNGRTAALRDGGGARRDGAGPAVVPVAQRWGLLGPVLPSGTVDAAFVGLDGKTYLFSGDRYVRYSGADYSAVDTGYPRTIAGDWGGMRSVTAAFVLDGATFLFGAAATPFPLPTPRSGQCYVRYSTADYSRPDAGHPRPMDEDNWWELPDALLRGEGSFAGIDAVFTGTDKRTYLFAGDRFVVFDNRERWWSEPRTLAQAWGSLPFERVDAAFVGNDGRTYVFSGQRYVRYSGTDYTRLDDRYPNDIATFWGAVPNGIARTGIVDAALVVGPHTYLFSGDQYVRYTGDSYGVVDNGYPKSVAASLRSEPRFTNLTAPVGKIDAALADRRSVHLFAGGRVHVVSDVLHRRYENLLAATPGCVFVEDGSVLVEDAAGWARLSAIEGAVVGRTPVRPRSLRTAPERFRTGLSAVLTGVDGNTYLFGGTSCFDVGLGREFPAAQDWGRPRNTVAQRGIVDAAFVGRDGRTYVFSGDQFVAYAASGYVDVDIDGRPQPVAEHWGGLTGVAIAYVHGDRTYLCEPAGEDGRFRYVVYSGADYARPDPGFPRVGDAGLWGIPAQEGFGRVSAVLVERDQMFFLDGTSYLQHNPTTGAWSFPHPLSRLWPGLPFGDAPVDTAFTGADGATYLFSRGRFTRHNGTRSTPAEPVGEHWGRIHNNFASTTRTQLVDAAFVDRGRTTYLFSGDQYVRYSGTSYRYIDDGYPRPVTSLRQEECFANLPDLFENLLADRVAAGAETVIDAVLADRRTVHLFLGRDCHVVSRDLEAGYDVDVLGRVRNTLADTGRVDASFVRGEHTYLFAGDQYVRYTGSAYAFVDEGYPRSIEAALPAEIGVAALPTPFVDGIDAALAGADGRTYLFAGRQFVSSDSPQPRSIAGTWGRVRNRFGPGSAIDAAFVSAAGALYAFAGDQYVRYTDPDAALADDGYPRTIAGEWGALPVEFERGVHGGFRFEGRTYLLHGEQYVRYTDGTRVDRLFPQPLSARFGPWVDYQLGDVAAITRFAQLQSSHSDADGGLAGVLTSAGTVQDPYQRLAAVFGWDVREIAWAVRHHAFLPPEEPANVDLELIFALVGLFAMTDKLGGSPSTVFADVWSRLHLAPPGESPAAGDALQRMLLTRRPERDRPAFERQLHEELNEATRDALVAAVIAHTDEASTPADLFDLLLLDVEMGGRGTTSAVREAIAATQLFFHRYFLNLQSATVRTGSSPDEVRSRLRQWWAWMKNYRVWEANRRVYLYPENYIRPELRTAKTPAFAALEKDLLQGELTPESARRAYTTYLDEYTEVSRLTIAGGYVYESARRGDPGWDLVLFGRTKTDPRRYYHRRATFPRESSRSAQWQPWSKVDVKIDSDRVYPVFAFDRVFVFWAGIERVARSSPTGTFTSQNKGTQFTFTNPAPATYRVRIFYSFHDLNGRWTPAQQLTIEPAVQETLEVSNVALLVEAATVMPGGADVHDNIVVRCAYTVTEPVTMAATRRTVAVTLTAELFTQPSAAVGFDDTGAGRFAAVFDEPVSAALEPFAPINAAMLARNDAFGGMMVRMLAEAAAQVAAAMPTPSVVMFNNPRESSTDRWFSFDYKGGSFLCKPAPRSSGASFASARLPLRRGGDRLPAAGRVDAGFTAPDGTNHFFDSAAHRWVTVDATGHQSAPRPIGDRWGRSSAGFPASGVVDAVVDVGRYTFAFAAGEYARFSDDSLAVMDPAYPKALESNTDRLPKWPRVDVGFTGLDNRTYLFMGEVFVDATRASRVAPVAERWGLVEGAQAGTGIFETGVVTGALVLGDHTFLISGRRYVRYTGSIYRFVDPGYPQDVAGNPDGLPEPPTVGYSHGASRYVFDNAAATYTVTRPGEPPELHSSTDLGGGTLGAPAPVDAACLLGEHLYLVSGTSFLRYTIGADRAIPVYVDPGYPKPCAVRVDALVALGGQLVVFSGDHYATIPAGQEPDTPAPLLPIDGSWGNLPHDFRTGLAGAFDTSDALYLLREDRYVRYPRVTPDGRPPELPHVQSAGSFEIVRLTTGTASTLNQRMFSGGVGAVVDVSTQETDERPSFDRTESGATVIKVRPERVAQRYLPVSSHLDFDSANGLYYWEVFFHAPLLIAGALSAAQRFEDAVTWFDYIFDPTQNRDHWRFLPFRETDVAALVDTCVADLAVLGRSDAAVAAQLQRLRVLIPVFAEEREVQGEEGEVLRAVPEQVGAAIRAVPAPAGAGLSAWHDLQETGAIIARLERRYELMIGGRQAALGRYLDDPFDPHAIAGLRTGAYRRAVVMAYIDNLLDWGDVLFRQYTGESIDQARMLYVLAADLLGPRPEDLGARPLRDAMNFGRLTHAVGEYDFLLRRAASPAPETADPAPTAVHASIATADDADAYFVIPENSTLADYWTRVEDRLGKIRSSLDILGVSRRVPLFEPPIDPMALVRATASGGGLGAAAAGASPVTAPHYRFSFMLRKAQELVDKLTQFGGDLLMALEKGDAEALTVLQNSQDGVVLAMTRAVKEAAIGSAAAGIAELAATQQAAQQRRAHYQALLDAGQLPAEHAQADLLTAGVAANAAAAALKVAAGIAHLFPQSGFGLFIFGVQMGGDQVGKSLDKFSDFSQSLGATLSGSGEILGLQAAHQRLTQDWQLQLDMATGDLAQIVAQQEGATHQLVSAQRDLEILEQEIDGNAAVARFLTSKFGTAELYQWMSGQLSGLYFQAYGLAYDLARQAERALQFERGLTETDTTIIQPVYWESRHSGLLAGAKLGHDLDRLAKAHLDNGRRGLEITKRISLAELDPIALLTLRSTGRCEFSFTEALFDYDFPGHYRRQVRTLSVTLPGPDGQPVPANAVLTQVQHKTVLAPDVKAVKHLLDAKGVPPGSIRSDWRPTQQIALSQVADGQDNNGLFELRFDDDRYLPFEGTGAVSTWRLELPGRHAGYHPSQLQDVVVTLRYTAEPGDTVFTNAVTGLLKPYPALRYLDVPRDFPDSWQQFQDGDTPRLTITITPDLFPGMSSRQIAAIYAHFETPGGDADSVTVNGNPAWVLRNNALVATNGLAVSTGGSDWTFERHGDRTMLTGLELVLGYTAEVR